MTLSGKRKVIDGEHILTMKKILTGLIEVEKVTKKRKITETKKDKSEVSKVEKDFSDVLKAKQNDSLVILDYIVGE